MNQTTTDWLLRIGVSFAFLYPPIDAWFVPDSWIGYFPKFILQSASGHELILLHAFGVIEIAIALWILSGKKIMIPAAIATLMLLAIVTFNFSQMEVVFRDVAIAAMSAALAFLHRETPPASA